MVGRRVYGKQLESSAGARYEIVLRAGGHDDDIAGGNRPSLTHKYRLTVALDEDQNLIGPDVDFLSDFAAGRHTHENELGAFGRVQYAPEVRVAACELLYGGRVGFIRIHPAQVTPLL